ncbi:MULTISPECIES: cell envelope biogenesis protein OmpA [Streptomyces]|uniref:Cell envelope biogenesis protein OmpA n=1 Tax=Streptomyces mordarskii TaxID=1226758 RepID=A0ABP3LQ43_9ACTN
MTTTPPVPLRCVGRPLSGGLVVPWITLEHNGHVVFGAIDSRKRYLALTRRLCQICGQRLGDRIYLLVRPMDVDAGYIAEPAVHPECLRYAKQHCPMLNGQASHYRRSPLLAAHPAGRPCSDSHCPCPDTNSSGHEARSGQPADDWDAWLITPANYRLKTGSQDDLLGLDLDISVLKIRPIRRNRHVDIDEKLDLIWQLLGLPPRSGQGDDAEP